MNRKPTRYYFWLGSILLALMAIVLAVQYARRGEVPKEGQQEDQQESSAAGAWISIPPAVWDWPEIPDTHFWLVQPEAMNHAISQLETRAIIEVSADEFRSLTGHELPAVERLKPFLVRAVAFQNRPWGKFTLKYKGAALWVQFGCLGEPNGTSRWPVVVLLPKEPDTVYVDLWSAI
jgi:hypothetical protein